MAPLLEQAYARIAMLPEQEQERVAALILEELDGDTRWDEAFAASAEALSRLGREALAEHRAGKTLPLDPDAL
ncbi:MAG: hypothetical protein HYU66_28800 [Armatimonadetes bacterium]|nr:hypothetical protein [Armatimonadota bacterium]